MNTIGGGVGGADGAAVVIDDGVGEVDGAVEVGIGLVGPGAVWVLEDGAVAGGVSEVGDAQLIGGIAIGEAGE